MKLSLLVVFLLVFHGANAQHAIIAWAYGPFATPGDVAFVGGSLADIGGHNMLEPAGLGIPVIVGPHTYNFEEIADRMLADGACVRVHNGVELGNELCRILANTSLRTAMGDAGLRVVASERGALGRLLGRAVALLKA